MNRSLFLAILAMDSYNRGYSQGIRLLTASGAIGSATITSDSLILGGDPDDRYDARAGFYAIAYSWNGERVISYRGTDNISVFGSGDIAYRCCWYKIGGFGKADIRDWS